VIRKILIMNRSGYDTRSLKRFFERGLRAMRIRARGRPPLEITLVSSPIRSRGCAEVKGHRMTIAMASWAKFSVRRLARLFEHEVAHTEGLDHEQMSHQLLYSTGPTPRWARGVRIPPPRRAPDQMQFLRRSRP
jgi:hypothetical protein